MKKISFSSICGVLLVTTACSPTPYNDTSPSDNTSTIEIFPIMKAVQNVDGSVNTTIELHDFSGGFIHTSFGDDLYSSLDDTPESFKNIETDLFQNAKNYSDNVKKLAPRFISRNFGIFTTVDNTASEYFTNQSLVDSSTPMRAYVTFDRTRRLYQPTGYQSATGSWVEFPLSFTITNPSPYSSISRADDPLTLTWSAPDNLAMELDIAVLCGTARWEYSVAISAPITGSHQLNTQDYFPVTSAEINSTCQIAFLLRRSQTGVVSASFGGGSFTGIQQRTVQFTSTP